MVCLAGLGAAASAFAQLAPTITQQPVSQHVVVGSNVTLTVGVSGTAPFTYEWFDAVGAPPISTTSTLTLSNIQAPAEPSGIRQLRVRVTNAAGSVTSNDAYVVVVPAQNTAPQAVMSAGGIPSHVGDNGVLDAVFHGALPMTFQWTRNGVALAGQTEATLYFTNAQTTDSGSYVVTATNALGSASSFPISVNVPPTTDPPRIPGLVTGRRATAGLPASLSIAATGELPLSYAWTVNGQPIAGATTATLTFPSVRFADGGNYQVTVSNVHGAVTSGFLTLAVNDPPRLTNLAIRSRAGTAEQTLTVGFVIGNPAGNGAPFFLVRGMGPSLAAFNLPGLLDNPQIAVIRNGGGTIATNDDWGGSDAMANTAAAVGAFPFITRGSADAALLTSFASGQYSVQVTGASGTTGVALAEIYDTTAAADATTALPRLVNVSARTQVGTGGDVLIAGFTIAGAAPKKVLLRGIGPTLATAFGLSGALLDPKLELYGSSGKLGENDDWKNDPDLAAAFGAVGAFALPGSSKDAALLATLPPGGYTVQISGVGNTTGIALVEIYEVP